MVVDIVILKFICYFPKIAKIVFELKVVANTLCTVRVVQTLLTLLSAIGTASIYIIIVSFSWARFTYVSNNNSLRRNVAGKTIISIVCRTSFTISDGFVTIMTFGII